MPIVLTSSQYVVPSVSDVTALIGPEDQPPSPQQMIAPLVWRHAYAAY